MSAAMVHGALSIALDMARVGYYLAPVTLQRDKDGEKRARYHGGERGSDGKYRGWDEISTRDPDKIRDWYVQYECSFLVDCGKSGIVGVDLDLKDDRDGIASWQAQNGPQGGIIVDTLSGGQHHYFAADPDRPLANSADRRTGIDVRGEGGHLYAPGTVILDERGNPEPGAYTARGPLYTPGDLPPAPELLHQQRKATSPNAGLPREDRTFTLAQAREYCRVKLDALRAAQKGERNHALNTAAFRLGHFVADHFGTTYEAAEKALRAALPEGYGSAPGEGGEITATIRSGLTDGIEDGVYVRSETETGSAVDEEDPTARRARLVAERVERLEVDAEAKREIARKARAQRPAIVDGLIDDLDTVEPPKMLVESLIPDGGVGFIAGKSGAYKSFLATAWACCIATGTPWLGKPEFKVHRSIKTLYVAAEGRSGAAARMKAWEAANGVSRRGKAILYGRPIHLNDADQVDELVEVVKVQGFGFVVIDTYHRSAPGTEENSSTEFGVVFAAAARLRDECECAVLFVDHTGHGGERLRGSSAKNDDADYWLLARFEGEDRRAEVQRTLYVRKLKDQESDGEWPIKLVDVEGHFPVVVVGEVAKPEESDQSWNDQLAWPLPGDVMTLRPKVDKHGKRRGREGIAPLALFMRFHAPNVDGATGLSRVEAIRELRKLTGLSDSTLINAWSTLHEAGRLAPAEGVKAPTGRHVWSARDSDPTPIGEGVPDHVPTDNRRSEACT